MKNRRQAFTLIEILVVVMIIGFLTAAGAASYTRALKNGRDGRRKSDLMNIQQAMVIYRYEKGSYVNWTSMGTNYLSVNPKDPTGAAGYSYDMVGTPGKTFCICAKMELAANGNRRSKSCGATETCASDASCYYCVTNP